MPAPTRIFYDNKLHRTGSRFRAGLACEFPFMSSARPELSPLRLPRGEIVFYPTRRPSIRVLTQLIENQGYEVAGFPIRTTDLSTLPLGVWHCAVVIGAIILFIVDPRGQSSSDSDSLTSGYGSSLHNKPDSDYVDPDFPEDGYCCSLPRT